MISRLTRFVGAVSAIAAGLLVLPAACGGGASETDEQVGKAKQRCFPGDYCDPGLTCVVLPIPGDGSILGTDGGQCFDLRDGRTPEAAAMEEAEPPAE